jgi:hypothetical protein
MSLRSRQLLAREIRDGRLVHERAERAAQFSTQIGSW